MHVTLKCRATQNGCFWIWSQRYTINLRSSLSLNYHTVPIYVCIKNWNDSSFWAKGKIVYSPYK